MRELRSQPGLYLFVPLILFQIIGNSLVALGAFDTPLLLTPGTLAVTQMQFMTTLLSLLLVFYAVESMERERSTGFSAIANALPIRTSALLIGKVIALCAIGVIVGIACLARVLDRAARAGPGRIQLPAVRARVGRARRADVPRVGGVRDRGVFGDPQPILCVRRLARRVRLHCLPGAHQQAELARQLADVELGAVERHEHARDRSDGARSEPAVRARRRARFPAASPFDTIRARIATRFASCIGCDPRRCDASFLRAAPALAGAVDRRRDALASDRRRARTAGAMDKKAKDYWKKNLATWKDAPLPALADVDMDLGIEPAERSWTVKGTYVLVNKHDRKLRQDPGHDRRRRGGISRGR